MSITSLLLLSSLLAAPLAATDTVSAPTTPAQVRAAEDWAADLAARQITKQLGDQANFAADSDSVCYKIRAYIFKRDDDHVPVLKGSTTCGPKQPRAENVVWPEARLVPAN